MTNAGRVCVIGIDALDPDLLVQWREWLPTFDRLMRDGRWARLASTFPPDSIPAWTTIYTGRDPSEHGGLEYVNYLDLKAGNTRLSQERLKGKTFWDRASGAGKRVLVVNPFLAYPAWPVNGLMVSGPVMVNGSVSTEPADAVLPAVPELGGIVDFPTRNTLESFYERCVRVTEDQGAFFRTLLQQQPWDLAYVLFLTVDRVKHFYWRFEDREDPCHETMPSRPHPIRDFYVLMDRILGELLAVIPEATATFILSDHGHQRRCTELFYINEWLRRNGWLDAPRGIAAWVGPRAAIERAKNLALDAAFRFGLDDALTAVAKWIPNRKALKRGDHVIRADASAARTSSFAGVNPFGGITLNSAELGRRGRSREQVIDDLVKGLQDVRDPRTGGKVVRWIGPREQVIPEGANREAYPDILFELEPAYGVSWSIFRPLFGPNVTHRKISGGHTGFGTLLTRGPVDPEATGSGVSVRDIYRLVLSHLHVS